MVRKLLIGCIVFAAHLANAQTLTVESIMRDPAWIGSQPDNVRWSVDGNTVYFSWNPEEEDTDATYAYTPTVDDAPRKLTDAQAAELPAGRGAFDADNKRWAFARQGDLFVYTLASGATRQLTNTLDRESSPSFSSDGTKLFFTRDDNLYSLTLTTGLVTQLTDLRKGTEPGEGREDAQAAWLATDNEALIAYIRDTRKAQEDREARREAEAPARPLPIYLGSNSAFNLQISPDERYVTFLKSSFGGGKATEMPNYLAASGYVEMETARPKVGASGAPITLWVYDREKETSYQVSIAGLPGLDEMPEYYSEYDREPEDFSREVSFGYGGVTYSADGNFALAQIIAADHKDRWIVQLNLQEGSVTSLDRQHDDAWIAGPGVGWFSGGILEFIPNTHTFYFVSEATCYAHLYSYDLDKGKKKALTKGEFEIYEPTTDQAGEYFFYSANDEHPGIRHIYRMPTKGGKAQRLTSLSGGIEFTVNGAGTKLAYRYSTATQPWELYWQPAAEESVAKRVTNSLSEEFLAYDWRTPEYVAFEARDGATVHARLYKPENAQPDGPAVIFVHGAGYLQNAHQWWSSYFREYMFHNLLVEQGYTVLDMDYRASAGYGRDWRTGIYRHMGGKDLTDQVDGAEWLVEAHGIDADRIGIYGGSYGGFITLMALFQEPEVFACGAALRSVTDWAHYNHAYTSNILNTPVLDSMAYRRSSPIYYAEGLNKPLLMCHGMLDDNVQFQDIVRLSQILIEQGKEDWELAVYPAEPHGFRRSDSWTDEYKRIFELFETYLK